MRFATFVSAGVRSKYGEDNLGENGEIMSLRCDSKLVHGNLSLRREACIRLDGGVLRKFKKLRTIEGLNLLKFRIYGGLFTTKNS
jgi:hypothetical protein